MRLFIGVGLDEPVRAAAASVIARFEAQLAAAVPDFMARWIPAPNLHITVWFLGEVADEAAAVLLARMRDPLPVPPFDLVLSGCGAFPPSGAPRVLWIGTQAGTANMVQAYGELGRRLAPIGYAAEKRRYSPHLTIARVKDPGGRGREVRRAVAETRADCGIQPVGALTLFRSRLSPRGASYEPLLRVPLA